MTISDGTPSPKAPSLRTARSFISHSGILPDTSSHAAGATTAVTLESATHAELASEATHRRNELAPVSLRAPSFLDSFSPHLESIESSDGEACSDHAELQLPELLSELMLAPSSGRKSEGPLTGYNPLTEDNTALDDGFLRLRVLVDKLELDFKKKLKQFFILSVAGKPIYSLNGNDDVLMGYMGLITTIIASFQEGMKKDVYSISLELLRIVVKNKYPLILVAISKIPHEITSVHPGGVSIMENQLECLHNYLLAVLSKAVITKNFRSGMNYDLRRMLSVQDFHALDTLAMKLTYGFLHDEDAVFIDTSYYLGAILGNSMRCLRISNTCRTKLNEVLLSTKKLRRSNGNPDFVSSISNRLTGTEESDQLTADLLFGFLTIDDQVLAHMRPRNHKLQSQDISTLLSAIQLNCSTVPKDKGTDLWIPLCMANFNSSGFVYCYVKEFSLGYCEKPITIILISGSKNSFYNMKEAANHVVAKVQHNKLLNKGLESDLSLKEGKKPISASLRVTCIKHFIYKRKEFDQVFIEDCEDDATHHDTIRIGNSLQILTLYSNLIIARGKEEGTKNVKTKKLTYTRLQLNGKFLTGFSLMDDAYEFYCLCEGTASSRTIISESLRIIRWCDRYKKRLFVREGVIF